MQPMNKLQYLQHCTIQKFGNNLLMTIIFILKHLQFENFFPHMKNLHQNMKFTMVAESNRKLVFLESKKALK